MLGARPGDQPCARPRESQYEVRIRSTQCKHLRFPIYWVQVHDEVGVAGFDAAGGVAGDSPRSRLESSPCHEPSELAVLAAVSPRWRNVAAGIIAVWIQVQVVREPAQISIAVGTGGPVCMANEHVMSRNIG